MQTTAVNFHSQQFFQPDIAEVDFAAKVIQQFKLAGFIGRLKDDGLKTEGVGKAISKRRVESALLIEQADAAGALPSFNYQLQGAGIEPSLALLDQFANRIF